MRLTRTLILSATIVVAGLLAGGAMAVDPPQPLAGIHVAYLYADNTADRDSWDAFLSGQGATFTAIPVDTVTSTNWAPFDLILAAPDTYNFVTGQGHFGPPGFADSDAIFASGLPIIAIWDGASLFDDIPALAAIGRNLHAGADESSAVALPARFWNIPLSTGVLPGSEVLILDPLATELSDSLHWIHPGAAGAELYALDPSDPDSAMLSGLDGGRYRVWGFGNPPPELTETGRRVFINYLLAALPPPPLDHHAVVPGAARGP